MLKTRQSNLKYSVEFKLEAVRLYEEEKLSYQTVADRMGIRSCSQVKQWVKKVCLFALQDLYNNEIVAFHISDRNDLKLVLDTLDKTTEKRDATRTIIHSDRGFQYTSSAYNKRLEQLGMIGSHSRKANCLDNACIESFFSHLKSELLYIYEYKMVDELIQAVQQYIQFYNNERFQKKLGHRSPIQYREVMAA
jgi:transposase InsO family protein